MIFDFIINKFFKTKLIKGIPECPDCPDEDDDCDNPCGCDCNSGGPCGGDCGGSGGAPAGRVMTIEEEVGEFLAVGQEGGGTDPALWCPTPPPPKCEECSGSGGMHNGPGTGASCQVTITY
jgi:hypothetical protein